MAPTHLRDRVLVALIEREQRRAEAGQPAAIRAKMNALVDEDIVQRALRRVAGRRARSTSNVRGICVPAAGREGPEREHRGHLGRRPLPRARARPSSSTTAATTRSTSRAPTGCRATSIGAIELMFPVRGARTAAARCSTRSTRCSATTSRGDAWERTATGRCRPRRRGTEPFTAQSFLHEQAERAAATAAGPTFEPLGAPDG